MAKPAWGIGALVMVTACGPQPEAKPPAKDPTPAPAPLQIDRPPFTRATLPRLWAYAGEQGPPFCLELKADGNAVLHAEFLEHNPVRWKYNEADGRLDLTLAHLEPKDYNLLRDRLALGAISGVDRATGTVSHLMRTYSEDIDFFKWRLTPAATLDSSERQRADRACPPLRATR